MGDMAEDFKALKQVLKRESAERKNYNRVGSEDILIRQKIPFKKFNEDHFRVGQFDFWPATGLFIHIKTKTRGRGVFNLIKRVKEDLCTETQTSETKRGPN